jgi:exodeoxyribonuclease V gamma subunit
MLNGLFEVTDETAFTVIDQAIGSLAEYCQHADYQQNISLSVVRDFLTNHFSQPDPGRQFMVGQITFCSMLPMRSIPFKIIAILGLNDGEFPRQRQPLGFDLMASSKSELGDRSRRGDDRYLFLEAIISARQSLYLSYQGRNIRNNNEKQPSIVLKELMEYLEAGYGWQLHNSDEESNNDVRSSDINQLPMQAFSEQNYLGKQKSFDPNWLKLKSAKKSEQTKPLILSIAKTVDDETKIVDVNELIRFFQHPAKAFAQKHLQLFFENRETQLDDTEPFSDNFLQSYLLRQQLLALYLDGNKEQENSEATNDAVATAVCAARVSGVFPDLPITNDSLERWRDDSENFSEFIQTESQLTEGNLPITFINAELDVVLSNNSHFTLSINFPVQASNLMFYRSSSAKGKDLFGLYLHQVILQCWQERALSINTTHTTPENNMLSEVNSTKGFYFDTKNQKPTQYRFSKIQNTEEHLHFILETYLNGQQQALLLNTELAEKFFKAKKFEQSHFEKIWSDSGSMLSVVKPLGQDPYMHYFWQQCPDFAEHQPTLIDVYQPMWQAQEQIK